MYISQSILGFVSFIIAILILVASETILCDQKISASRLLILRIARWIVAIILMATTFYLWSTSRYP